MRRIFFVVYGFWASFALAQPNTQPNSLPTPSAISLDTALRYFAEGNTQKAQETLEQYITQKNVEPIAYYYLGRCYETHRDFSAAQAVYQQILQISPLSEEATIVRLRLARIESKKSPKTASTQKTTPPPEEDSEEPYRPPPPLRSSIKTPLAKLGQVSIGIGSFSILSGLMFASLAKGKERVLESSGAIGNGQEPIEFSEDLQALFQQGRRFNQASIAALTAGGITLLGGILLGIREKKRAKTLRENRRVNVQLHTLPKGGAFLGVTGAF